MLFVDLDITMELVSVQSVHDCSIFHTPDKDHLELGQRGSDSDIRGRKIYLAEFPPGRRLMEQMVVDTLERGDTNTSRYQQKYLSEK